MSCLHFRAPSAARTIRDVAHRALPLCVPFALTHPDNAMHVHHDPVLQAASVVQSAYSILAQLPGAHCPFLADTDQQRAGVVSIPLRPPHGPSPVIRIPQCRRYMHPAICRGSCFCPASHSIAFDPVICCPSSALVSPGVTQGK